MSTLDFSQIIAAKLNGEDVIRITDTVNTLWELQPAFTDYLSFTDTSGAANRFALSRVGVASSLPDVSIEYSFDKTNWQTWVEENATRTLTIPANGTVYLRGTNSGFNISSDDDRYTFGSSGSVAAGGDIVSLVSADGTATALPNYFCRGMFKGMTTLTKAPAIGVLTLGASSCRCMFDGCTNLTDVSLVDFSNITLGNASCYWMFRNCTSITATPPLNVTTTQNTCCFGMFTGCSSMTTAANVHLNATSLSNYAYGEMFRDCSSLVTFPSFTSSPLTLATQSLASMFQGCTSMTTAPAVEIGVFASGLFGGCLAMFKDCTSLTDVSNVVLSATTLSLGAYKQMFQGCTSLTTAPEIQATTLADGNGDISNGCLAYMFRGCSSLAHIKVAFTDWDSDAASNNLYAYNWVYGVAQSGVFECPSALPVQMDTNHIPTGWRVVNTDTNYAIEYFGIEDESGSANTLTMRLSSTEGSAYYSTDDGTTWNTMPSSDTQITIPAGGRVIFKNTGYCEGWHFSATGAHSVNGNLDSLWNGDNFLQSGSEFQCPLCMEMFRYDTTLVHSKDLYVGAYTKGHYFGFVNMFDGCTGLVDVPDFSSFTQVGHYQVFDAMFHGCTSITEGLDFSNMVLEDWLQWEEVCFTNMYSGCTSLNKAYAPKGNFWNTTIFTNWLSNVANSGTLYADSSNASQIPQQSANGCPTGWSMLVSGYVEYTNENGSLSASPLNQGDTLQYKVNGGSWQNYTGAISWSSLNVGDTVTFKEVGASSGSVLETSVTMAKVDIATPYIENVNGKTVTITTEQTDSYAQASVYYTTDGSTPTDQSSVYTAPFDVASYNTTVKAKVIPSNSTWYNGSEQASGTITDVQKKFLVWNNSYNEDYSVIDTGIAFTDTMKIRFACEIDNDDAQFWMMTEDWSFFAGGNYSEMGFISRWADTDFSGTYPATANVGKARDFTITKDTCVDNLTLGNVYSGTNANTYSGNAHIKVLMGRIRFSRLQIWDTVNGVETLLFNGYAAVKSGVYGIWDAVSGNMFYDRDQSSVTWESSNYGSAATVSNAISASSRFYTGGDFCARATTSQRTYTPITWYWYSKLGSSAPAADPYPDGHKVYSTADYGTADNIYCSVGTGHSGENITLKLVARIWGYEDGECRRNITLTIP